MTTLAGHMSQTPTGNPQWRLCDGSWIFCNGKIKDPFTARPATGVSKGTYRDYWRNNGRHAGSRGINGFMCRLPYDPSATWYISTADDSSETALVSPPTPQHPPAGVK